MAIKRDKYDAIVSSLVREREDWTCERCGKVSELGRTTGKDKLIHCSHYFGRRHKSTRYDLDNCFCLCATCHSFLEDRPPEHTRFVTKIMGHHNHDELLRKHHTIYKWTKAGKDEMLEHYKSELNRIKDIRKLGVSGYLEVVNYE